MNKSGLIVAVAEKAEVSKKTHKPSSTPSPVRLLTLLQRMRMYSSWVSELSLWPREAREKVETRPQVKR